LARNDPVRIESQLQPLHQQHRERAEIMSNTKPRRSIFLAVAAGFLSVAAVTGCGKKDVDPENKTEAAEDKPEKTDEATAKDPRKGKRAEGVRSSAENPFAGTGNARLIELWRKATEENDSEAQIELGVCYQTGDGVECDMAKSAEWFRKAAEQGHAVAQILVAQNYAMGLGVNRDMAEAAKWYRKAAEQDIPSAQFTLGQYYFEGTGVKKDYEEAVKWWRKAAEQDYSTAQFNLGGCYFEGLGVEKDKAEAAKWFRLAAENGDKDAPEALKELGL
jgi:TPR repeat protein